MSAAEHPVLGLRDGLERVSRTACVSSKSFDDSRGESLAAALRKVRLSVDKRVGDKDRVGTYYYVTYEVVVDDDGDPGRPVRPPVDGSAAGVVLDGMRQAVAA